MYQITLSLKERQELVQALKEQIVKLKSLHTQELNYWFDIPNETTNSILERIAHLENIKLKAEAAKIMPIKGLKE